MRLEQIVKLANQGRWDEIELGEITNLALLEAIRLKQVSIVEAINKKDYDLALRRACASQLASLVPLLLPHRKNINAPSLSNKNFTALHFAARNGMADTVRQLLAAGAFVNMRDNDGNTACHLACANKHFRVARILAENGAYFVNNLSNKNQLQMIGGSFAATSDVVADYDAFKANCIKNTDSKNKLPSVTTTQFKALGQDNHALMTIKKPVVLAAGYQFTTSKVTQPLLSDIVAPLPQPELAMNSFVLDEDGYDKFISLATQNQVPHLTIAEFVAFDKKYNDVSTTEISEALRTDGSLNNETVLVCGSLPHIQKLLQVAEQWSTLEAKLNVKFDCVIRDSELKHFFLRSKEPVSSVNLRSEHYAIIQGGVILIDVAKIPEILAARKSPANKM